MRSETEKKLKWFNRIVIVVIFIALALWTWWLFRPQTFTLRKRWEAEGFICNNVAFALKGNLLAALVVTTKTLNFDLVVTLWQIPNGQQFKSIVVSRNLLSLGSSQYPVTFPPMGICWRLAIWKKVLGK